MDMTKPDAFFTAFMQFWRQFTNPFTGRSVPAFQTGYAWVPQAGGNWQPPQSFPYIVYDIAKPGFAQNVLITATVWDRQSGAGGAPGMPGFFPVVNAILDQISEAIPIEAGAWLDLIGDNGAIWLQRGSPWVMFPPGDERDPTIVRGVVNIAARGY